MRPSQKGRGPRNKGGRNKPVGNVINRVFESAGPEGKVRGTPQQIIEKYQILARDAQTAGERVLSESFLQHAEHYTRLLNAAYEQVEQRRQQQGQFQPDGQGHAEGGANGEDRGSDARSFRGDSDPRSGEGRVDSLETFDSIADEGPVDTPESTTSYSRGGSTAAEIQAEASEPEPAEDESAQRKPEPRRRRRKPAAAEPAMSDAEAPASDAGGA